MEIWLVEVRHQSGWTETEQSSLKEGYPLAHLEFWCKAATIGNLTSGASICTQEWPEKASRWRSYACFKSGTRIDFCCRSLRECADHKWSMPTICGPEMILADQKTWSVDQKFPRSPESTDITSPAVVHCIRYFQIRYFDQMLIYCYILSHISFIEGLASLGSLSL